MATTDKFVKNAIEGVAEEEKRFEKIPTLTACVNTHRNNVRDFN